MAWSATDSKAKSALGNFLRSIDYPEEAPAGAASFTLQVDGGEIIASDTGSAIRLVCRLADDAAELPRLAEYAAGRMLREDAVLAFGSLEVWKFGSLEGGVGQTSKPLNLQSPDCAFLWQEIPAAADALSMRRCFETFADSCDWWRARLAAPGPEAAAAPFPEMMIRP